jgi:hypothetical protein|tara:strand:- start:6569 stop:7633 length:1065 start_codon:yes stop_codon:yes gene_type:complete
MVAPAAVAKRFWAYGTLCKTPDDDKWSALDADCREVALNMSPDEIGQCLWSLGTIRKMPTKGTWTVLEIAIEDTASRMSAKSVAVCVWAYAKLTEQGLKKPDRDAWRELEVAIEKHANENAFANEDLVNIMHAFATLPREAPAPQSREGEEGDGDGEAAPPAVEGPVEGEEGEKAEPIPNVDECWDSLERSLSEKAGDEFTPIQVATTLWIFCTMHKQPSAETWTSLDTAMNRIAHDLKGTLELARLAFFYHSLNKAPVDEKTRWLMHNAVLQQPTGLLRIGLTRESNGARALSRMETREAAAPASIDAEGWLRWAMNEPAPVPQAKHALTLDPNAKPKEDDETSAEGKEVPGE